MYVDNLPIYFITIRTKCTINFFNLQLNPIKHQFCNKILSRQIKKHSYDHNAYLPIRYISLAYSTVINVNACRFLDIRLGHAQI